MEKTEVADKEEEREQPQPAVQWCPVWLHQSDLIVFVTFVDGALCTFHGIIDIFCLLKCQKRMAASYIIYP